MGQNFNLSGLWPALLVEECAIAASESLVHKLLIHDQKRAQTVKVVDVRLRAR